MGDIKGEKPGGKKAQNDRREGADFPNSTMWQKLCQDAVTLNKTLFPVLKGQSGGKEDAGHVS